ncbi:MAG: TonB-dependent receptor [Sphingobacteriaceae bacterium]|nr:MAG: TonB-dependent receptor [Sphingobacteriaceae bacterium]
MMVSVLCWFPALAQTTGTTISGTVSDDRGISLPGVTVTAKGTKISAASDLNGKYTINVPSGATTLTFSYIGMQAQDVTISGRTNVDVTLKTASTQLDDVVVIGYGSTRRANVTSSISSVTEKDIKNLPVAGIDQALQGKVAGVTVVNNSGQPGGGVTVKVRGITTVNGNEPLYVIDGVPIDALNNTSLSQNVLGGGEGQTAQSVLATINPNDIESIDILKDASAQAIYGSRGAYGVVLINTKKGKSGQGKINYDVYYGISTIPKKLDIMNLRQYAQYSNSLVNEIKGVPGSNIDSVGEFRDPSLLGHGTDWQDEIYQRGRVQSHQLSFSGGTEKTQHYFSAGYLDQTGILLGTGFKRYTLRGNIDHQVRDWLKAGFSTNMSRAEQKIGLTDAFDAVTSTVLYNTPVSPVRDAFGNYLLTTNIGGNQVGITNNPVLLTNVRNVRQVSTRAFGALYAEIKFMKGLTLRNEGNYDFSLASGKAFQPYLTNSQTGAVVLSPSRLRESRNNSLYWAIKNYLNYDNSFGKHTVSGTVGHEAQRSDYDYINVKRENLKLNLQSLNAGDAPDASGARGEDVGAGAGTWTMESFFARVGYSYDGRYAITGTIRRDGSSNFGPGNRWGTFPAVSASWTATNEAFLKNIKYLSYLKVRLGYGEVGGQSVGQANAYSSNISLIPSAPFGPGGLPYNVANPFVSWEAVKTYNLGVDASLFDGRIDVTVDVYKKVTTDMLLPTQLPAFSGLGTAWNDIQTPITNAGQMTNKGIDIAITSHNFRNKDFTWNTSVTFTRYKNVLDKLNSATATIAGSYNEYGTLSLVALSQPGKAVGSFYGYVTDGLIKTEEDLNALDYGLPVAPGSLWYGDVKFKDLDGNGKIDDKDVTTIGNPNPDFTAGMTNTFSYKGFDLSVFLYASIGGDIFNYTRRQTEALSSPWNNQLVAVLDRYTADNTDGTLPRYNQWHNNNYRISDRFIESATYLRIQNVALGYNLPKAWVNKVKVAAAKLYVSAQNLYTFTNYSGYDPELGAVNRSVTFMNVDNGHYPNPRTFTLGANIEF